jgi:hypothetical protein
MKELMTDISIVQCVYKENPYILESLKLNLKAIQNSNLINDYEYIIFNDNGDKSIYDSISDIVEENKNIRYIYSDINFGKKKCRGGWVGSIPHIKKNLIHIVDQDDVVTKTFYDKCLDEYEGACDFEYWSRVLFNERKCCYIKNPLWLYRISEYSAGLEVIDGKQNNEHHRKIALKKIKEKYFRLWNEKKKLNHTTNTI